MKTKKAGVKQERKKGEDMNGAKNVYYDDLSTLSTQTWETESVS